MNLIINLVKKVNYKKIIFIFDLFIICVFIHSTLLGLLQSPKISKETFNFLLHSLNIVLVANLFSLFVFVTVVTWLIKKPHSAQSFVNFMFWPFTITSVGIIFGIIL